MAIQFQYYQSPIGELKIASFQEKLVLADWRYRKMRQSIDQRLMKVLDSEFMEFPSEIIKKSIIQLEQYFKCERQEFDLPIHLIGTEFQKSVWKQLQEIPYGETRSYLKLSQELGNEKAIRAVASANGANGISIIIPCHRIIGSNKELVGYAGGLPGKKKLLELENPNFNTQLTLF